MKNMAKSERKAIIKRINKLLKMAEEDNRTLREIERLIIGWMRLRREMRMRENM